MNEDVHSEDIGGYPDLYVATGKERREGVRCCSWKACNSCSCGMKMDLT